ncbi:MAG: aspartate carbamoyltransferase catalytic subunit [Actinobacteria bacterium]|nr:aspartate carbamoyltransferase catalytic subunit [Actinomycetota bacterium]MBU4313209.1 aspartate carbamoyltransferase catalytic subunit [Actinomycetota bacterium]MBU4483668.1 aspartate carbamoyltransferase catalytic subunit [Actinomycetota bacterium]MCG2790725.1 aspartate carbamoyltransferase catalytic subunit [Actinomycetes bacterium]
MLSKKSILDADSLSLEDIKLILSNADSFLEISRRDVKKVPTLRGKTVINLFFEPSTRTKTSFEIAAKRLSADIINFSPSTSSLKKGESIIDTIKTILSMKVDLIVIRHSDSGTVKMVDRFVDIPVINAGDGKYQHPTQALLDLYTIKKRFGKFEGLKVAIVGDFLDSRVARSDMNLFEKMGMDVTIVSPTMFLPEDFSGMKVKHCIDDVIEDADIVYMLRMQFERQDRKFYPSVMEYNRFLTLNMDRLGKMKPGSIVMHPGPVNRGIEITDEVMDTSGELAEKIVIEEQVTFGVAVRMAILYLMLG